MLVSTRRETPRVALGVDHGTKFEGFSVVVDRENALNVKLDLPDKKKILKKLEERKTMRRARRFRKCRRRPCRSDNRSRKDFLAPSQRVLVDSRLKVLGELCRVYPINVAGAEDVGFDHATKRWGANFSTVEIGKAKIRQFYTEHNINFHEYKGYETQELRKDFGYRKIKDKAADRFESHCCDSLTLACAVGTGEAIMPGPFLVVDGMYRAVRRRLHDAQPTKGGASRPVLHGSRRGAPQRVAHRDASRAGQALRDDNGSFRYHDRNGKRQTTKALWWISSSFIIKRGGDLPVA